MICDYCGREFWERDHWREYRCANCGAPFPRIKDDPTIPSFEAQSRQFARALWGIYLLAVCLYCGLVWWGR